MQDECKKKKFPVNIATSATKVFEHQYVNAFKTHHESTSQPICNMKRELCSMKRKEIFNNS